MRDSQNYLSQEKLHEAIASVPALGIRKWADTDVQHLFLILYWCGLRPSEGIRLKKENFNLETREIYLGKTKTNRHDRAAIPKQLIPILEKYLATAVSGRLLPGLKYNTLYRWINRLGVLCDIPAWKVSQEDTGEKTKAHIFRKSISKDMLYGEFGEMAQSVPVIAAHLRHKSVATTMNHYLKADLTTVKRAF